MRELKQTHIITAHMNICSQDSLSAFTMRRYREWCNDPRTPYSSLHLHFCAHDTHHPYLVSFPFYTIPIIPSFLIRRFFKNLLVYCIYVCVSPTVVHLRVSKWMKWNKMADTHKDGRDAHIRGVGQGLRHAGCLITFFILYVVYTSCMHIDSHTIEAEDLFGSGNEPSRCSSGPSIVVDLRYYFRDVCWRIGMVRSEEPKLYI